MDRAGEYLFDTAFNENFLGYLHELVDETVTVTT
jgi:hypothetical protein